MSDVEEFDVMHTYCSECGDDTEHYMPVSELSENEVGGYCEHCSSYNKVV